MNGSTSMYVATAASDNYTPYVGAMLSSLFANNQHTQIQVFLLSNSLLEDNLQLLQSLAHRPGHQITYIKIDNAGLIDLKVDAHITLETYFRLLISEVLPGDITKVLYLDADIIIRENIASLWNMAIDKHFLAAVRDVTANRNEVLDIPATGQYFNAGVMLINLEKWRNHETLKRCLTFMQKFPEKIMYWDQDVLNAVLYDKWLPLHPKYNMQAPLFMEEFESYHGEPQQLQEAIADPVIIHYSAPLKPWHYLSYHPYTSEYYKYLSLTPWKDYKPTDKNLVRMVRKALRPYLRKVGVTRVLGKHLY